MNAQPTTPKDSAVINLLVGGTVTVLGVALLLFGSPTRPGERRNALFLALEGVLGYEGSCGVFIAIGVIFLAVGIVRYLKAARSTPPAA